MAAILIADDDPEYLKAFCMGLEALGHSAKGVSHSAEVLLELEAALYDVVFLDVLMPGGGAITLVHDVRSDHPDLPIVVLTGNASIFESPIMTGGLRQASARLSKTASLAEIGSLIYDLI